MRFHLNFKFQLKKFEPENFICSYSRFHTLDSIADYRISTIKISRQEFPNIKLAISHFQRSAKMVLYPLLLAERDREYLKQLNRNRDEEAKLMANVEGWEVGTWYGEPIFKTIPKDKLVDPSFDEFYVHSHYRDYAKRAHLKLWT